MKFIDNEHYYSIENIDENKTVLNGKKVCNQYRLLVEKRIKMILASPLSGSSFIETNRIRNYNSFEINLIRRIEWNNDQVTDFINNILILEKVDKTSGLYLKLKYTYDKTDIEIAKKMKISDRTLRNYKSRAYFQIAVWSNKVEYIYSKKFCFIIT